MRQWLNRKWFGFPRYGYLISVLLFALQAVLYRLCQALNAHLPAYDLTIWGFDDKIPFVSWFVVFYGAAYLSWALGPVFAAKVERRYYFNYVMAVAVSLVVGAVIFVVFPTTNVRPEVSGNSIFDQLVRFIYANDTPERPINLFPSYHCMLNIFCYIGVAGRKEVSLAYRIGTLVMAVLVVISTQVLKQHYIVDALGALAVCLVTFLLSRRFDWGKWIDRLLQPDREKTALQNQS